MNHRIMSFAIVVASFGAAAETTIGRVSGTVTAIRYSSNQDPHTISIGDSVSTTYVFGNSSSEQASLIEGKSYSFDYGALTFSTNVRSLSLSSQFPGQIYLLNNGIINVGDIYSVNSGPIFTPVGAYQLNIRFSDRTPTYDLIAGLNLPRSIDDLDISAATSASGEISYTGPNALTDDWSVEYSIQQFSLMPVPEPSTQSLFLFAALLALVSKLEYRRKTEI